MLYGPPSAVAQDPEQAPDYPLRDAKPANDGNLYPYNSKLRPPPLWIDEDGVEIADQPKVFHSHPHYYPYTAQRPPPFVPPQPQTDAARGVLCLQMSRIALLGNYMATSFVTAADGHGVTLITEGSQAPMTWLR